MLDPVFAPWDGNNASLASHDSSQIDNFCFAYSPRQKSKVRTFQSKNETSITFRQHWKTQPTILALDASHRRVCLKIDKACKPSSSDFSPQWYFVFGA